MKRTLNNYLDSEMRKVNNPRWTLNHNSPNRWIRYAALLAGMATAVYALTWTWR
jgi:hypothetical protein